MAQTQRCLIFLFLLTKLSWSLDKILLPLAGNHPAQVTSAWLNEAIELNRKRKAFQFAAALTLQGNAKARDYLLKTIKSEKEVYWLIHQRYKPSVELPQAARAFLAYRRFIAEFYTEGSPEAPLSFPIIAELVCTAGYTSACRRILTDQRYQNPARNWQASKFLGATSKTKPPLFYRLLKTSHKFSVEQLHKKPWQTHSPKAKSLLQNMHGESQSMQINQHILTSSSPLLYFQKTGLQSLLQKAWNQAYLLGTPSPLHLLFEPLQTFVWLPLQSDSYRLHNSLLLASDQKIEQVLNHLFSLQVLQRQADRKEWQIHAIASLCSGLKKIGLPKSYQWRLPLSFESMVMALKSTKPHQQWLGIQAAMDVGHSLFQEQSCKTVSHKLSSIQEDHVRSKMIQNDRLVLDN